MFPLEEKSGLNVSNRYNIHNAPKLESEDVISSKIRELQYDYSHFRDNAIEKLKSTSP